MLTTRHQGVTSRKPSGTEAGQFGISLKCPAVPVPSGETSLSHMEEGVGMVGRVGMEMFSPLLVRPYAFRQSFRQSPLVGMER